MGTRPNQLFLTECEDKNVSYFQDVLNWFRDALVIIFPETRYRIDDTKIDEIERLGSYLETFGTGVSKLELRTDSI